MRARQQGSPAPPCPYGNAMDPSELALLPKTALSVFVPLTYRAPPQSKPPQKKQWGGMLRKASKLLTPGPATAPAGPYIFSVRPATPLPSTFHRLNPVPAEPDNPYGVAYPSHAEQSAAIYPKPICNARPPAAASSTAILQHTDQLAPQSESQRVAGATTRSGFTGGVTGLTGFTGITGFTDHTHTTGTDGRNMSDYPFSSTAPTPVRGPPGTSAGWNEASGEEATRSAGVVSRSTGACTTSFNRVDRVDHSNHVYVPPMVSAASFPGHAADRSNSLERPPTLTHATSAPTPESMDLGIGPNFKASMAAAENRKAQENGTFTIPEDRTWSGMSADGTGDNPLRAGQGHSLASSGGATSVVQRGAAALDEDLSRQIQEMSQQAAAASAEKRERVDAVVQAIEKVQSFGMDQQILRQYHMPPGAPVHRGQNSCSMCIMSALNGHKYAIKHYGSDAILAEEQELFMRTPVHMVCPQVRHLDAKNHRHLLQSAVCITPALRPLDKHIERHRTAFNRRPEQVHLLARLATVLDLLHEHGKRIHGNLTPRHVLVDTHQSPHSFTIVDFSCARGIGDSSYAPWGLYDPAFAAPEVISATISAPQVPDPEPQVLGNDEGVSAAADLWSLGMLLFYACAGGPYWPRSYKQIDMVQCLLGHSSLPHEANPHMLDAAGSLSPIVARLLSRSPEIRPTVLDVGEFASHGVCEAVMGLTSSDGAVSKFCEVNRQTLCQEMPHAPPDADTLLAMQRSQMHAAHRLVCGQELCVIFQVWQPVPGHVTQRQLCPLVTYGGAQNKASFTEQLDTMTAAKMEPVFQFVAGQKYYLSFLIQNRDPTSLRKLPFTDCIEMRLGVGSEGDLLHEKPRIRQSSAGLWWGEMPWSPSTYQHDLCQNPSLTSEGNPGTSTVAVLLAVPFMGSPLRVKRSLCFNMNSAGTVLASNPLNSTHVDIHQHPDAARREIIKHGLTSTVCLGSTAAMMVHERLM